MTPDAFQHNVIAWIDVACAVLAALGTLIGAACGFVALAKSKLNELRINGHSQDIKTLMLNTPAPSTPASVNVNAAPPSDIIVNAPSASPPNPTPPASQVGPLGGNG